MSSVPLDPYGTFNGKANQRKLQLYWLGFMEGVVASGHIERREPKALEAEVGKLLEFVFDADANDLIQDLRADCFESEQDMLTLLNDFISEQKSKLDEPSGLSPTDCVNRFLGFCAGIYCDGQILPDEVAELSQHLKSTDQLADNPVLTCIKVALENGGSSCELGRAIACSTGECFADTGLAALGQTIQLTEDNLNFEELSFQGRVFVLTGHTRISRHQLKTMICEAGGEVHERVTKKTNYVVYGLESSPSWKTTSHGKKLEYAKTLISKGTEIKLVPEHKLEASFKLN